MSATYLCTLRPPGYAQIPDGYDAFDQWIPPRYESVLGREKVLYHGWVSYPEELPKDKAERFALERISPPKVRFSR